MAATCALIKQQKRRASGSIRFSKMKAGWSNVQEQLSIGQGRKKGKCIEMLR